MKKFRVIELSDDYKSAHYVECTKCEQISPFAIKIDDTATVIFMDEIISVEEVKNE